MARRLTDADIEVLLDPSNTGTEHAPISALISELRRQSATTPDLPPSDELAEAIRSAGRAGRPVQAAVRPSRPRTRKVLAGLTTVVATTAGKVLVGTALAASAVGGAHATDLVALPGLPAGPPAPITPPAGLPSESDGAVTTNRSGASSAEPPGLADGDVERVGDGARGGPGDGTDDAATGTDRRSEDDCPEPEPQRDDRHDRDGRSGDTEDCESGDDHEHNERSDRSGHRDDRHDRDGSGRTDDGSDKGRKGKD